MNSVFETAAKVSTPLALAGFIAAAFFLLCRQIIAREIFPALTKRDSHGLLSLIVNRLFSLSLVAMLLGFVGFIQLRAGEKGGLKVIGPGGFATTPDSSKAPADPDPPHDRAVPRPPRGGNLASNFVPYDRNEQRVVARPAPPPPPPPPPPAPSLSPAALSTLRSGGIAVSVTGRPGISEQLAQGLRDSTGLSVVTNFFRGGSASGVLGRLEEGDNAVLTELGLDGAQGTVVIGNVEFDAVTNNGQYFMTYASLNVTIRHLDGRAPVQRTLRSRGSDFNEPGAYQRAVEASVHKLAEAIR
jgi:hypothetical protein